MFFSCSFLLTFSAVRADSRMLRVVVVFILLTSVTRAGSNPARKCWPIRDTLPVV